MEYFNYKVLLNNSEKFIDMFDKMVNKGLKPTHQIKKEYKCEFYTANPYICNPIETSKLFCDMINIEYEYEEKGNMQNYGTFYIS